MCLGQLFYIYSCVSKWEMKRQVLFQKGKTTNDTAIKKTDKAKAAPESKKEVKIATTSKSLYDWLETHELINLAGLCKKVGYDRANFVNGWGSGKELKPEVLAKFIEILKSYGYAQ